MIYSLNTHQKAYSFDGDDFFQCFVIVGSGMPYAIRHWQVSNTMEDARWGHRIIAVAEGLPLIGIIAALFELLVVNTYLWVIFSLPSVPQGFQSSLLQLNEIPSWLHEDGILKKYKCPITQMPIRYPVGDPNGRTLYEKKAIIQWIQRNGTSPVTRQALSEKQLVPVRAIQSLIDYRLEQLQKLIEKSRKSI